jgi:hypothetical protein
MIRNFRPLKLESLKKAAVNSRPALRSVVQRRRRALSDACLFLPSAHHSEKSSTLEHQLRPGRQKLCTDR